MARFSMPLTRWLLQALVLLGWVCVVHGGLGEELVELIGEVRRVLRGELVHPLSERSALLLHYDFRDFQSGCRGLGYRRRWDFLLPDPTQSPSQSLEEEGEEEGKEEGVAVSVVTALSFKRLKGLPLPHALRYNKLHRLCHGSLSLGLPRDVALSAAYAGDTDTTRLGAGRVERWLLEPLGMLVRWTLSPQFCRHDLKISGSVPRVPWFRPSVDLFSLGVGCEWCEPLYIETPHTPDTTTQDKELTKGFPRALGGAAVRVSLAARSLRPGGVLKVQYVDNRPFGGQGVSSATFRLPITSHGTTGTPTLDLEHTWQVYAPWLFERRRAFHKPTPPDAATKPAKAVTKLSKGFWSKGGEEVPKTFATRVGSMLVEGEEERQRWHMLSQRHTAMPRRGRGAGKRG